MKTVAIMQPYFAPYAGYFRLFAASDLFVVYDCVQFPRRGWVHRNRLPDRQGNAQWLTLPIRKAVREVAIRDLGFASDAAAQFESERRRFPSLRPGALPAALEAALAGFDSPPHRYIERLLEECARLLELPFHVVRSSTFRIDPAFRGQDRILEILRLTGGDRYVNAPGGRELYDAEAFRARGVDLRFLPDHAGPSWSILHRLATEPANAISAEILSGSALRA